MLDVLSALQALKIIERTSSKGKKQGYRWLGNKGIHDLLASLNIAKANSSECQFEHAEPIIEDYQIKPTIKYFRPKVLQAIDNTIECKRKKLDVIIEDFSTYEGHDNKENLGSANKPSASIGSCKGAFKKLNFGLDFSLVRKQGFGAASHLEAQHTH